MNVTEPLTSEETRKKWEILLSIGRLQPITGHQRDLLHSGSTGRKRSRAPFPNSSPTVDPFDCSSLKVMSTHDIAESTIHRYLKKWNELDDRRVKQKATPANHARGRTREGEALGQDENTSNVGGWRAKEDRLTLPEGFDYNTKNSDFQKQAPIDDGHSGDRIISMKNPGKTLSYHKELWELFDSIPTYCELEDQTRQGHNVNNVLRVYKETRDLTGASADSHMLSRLRMPDRHGIPQLPSPFPCKTESRTKRKQNPPRNAHSGTLMFEFWRRQPKRGASPDCNRMLIEFLDSQTLFDIHLVLARMTEDDLWTAGQKENKNGSIDQQTMEEAAKTEFTSGKEKVAKDEVSSENMSGCFFIENIFYKTGPVDYARPITDWIDRNSSNAHTSLRRHYLGIDPSVDIKRQKKMKDTQLNQVPFRLNIRYYHSCHGDVETSVMLVDRNLIVWKEGNSSDSRELFPLIHDIWTVPRLPAAPICDACHTCQSIFETSTDCKITDGGPRSLCLQCCSDLKLLKNEKQSVKLYRIWRGQANLSNRLAREHGATFFG